MKNENKTKDQLIQELARIQKKNTDLEGIIIEEKRTKKELKESEKKYKDLVEETPLGIANIGVTGKIIYINKRLEKISGYSREEVIGKNVFKLGVFPDEMLKILRERLKARLREGSVRRRREILFKCRDGKWIWIEITAKLIKKWGIPANFRITVQDITERKQIEEELKDSEKRLKILFEYAPDAYYINDLKGKFIDGNKAAERVIGYKKEELIGKGFLKLKLLSINDIPKAAKALAKNIMGQPTGPDKFVLNRKDNSKVTVEIFTYPVKIKGKTLVLGIARDITERKKAEKILRESEERYRDLFENMMDGFIIHKLITDVNGNAVDYILEKINNAAEKILSWKREDIERKKATEVYGGDTPFIERYAKVAQTGKAEYFIDYYPRFEKWYEITSFCLKKGYFANIFKDITESKQAEQKIKQGYEKLQRTMEATIYTISKIVETRDPYTAGHQQKVSQLATSIAKEMKLSQDKIEGIRIASLVHDIGKISLPAEILSKPSKLNEIEYSLIKDHPQIGYDILKSIEFPWPIAQIVLQHHERLNGSGYPNKLRGEDILLEARIMGVADTIEAMSSHRPYRPAKGIDKALEEISQNKGILYDSEVVDTCLKLFKEKSFRFN